MGFRDYVDSIKKQVPQSDNSVGFRKYAQQIRNQSAVNSFKSTVHSEEEHDAVMRHMYGSYSQYIAQQIEENTSLSDDAKANLISYYGITESDTNRKKAQSQGAGGASASQEAFRSLVRGVNDGSIKVSSNISDAQYTNWGKSVSDLITRVYNYLKIDGYKQPDTALSKELDNYISKAADVAQYLRANRANIKDYEKTYEGYVETVNYLRSLSGGLETSNKFFSQYKTEEDYNNSIHVLREEDTDELKRHITHYENAYNIAKDVYDNWEIPKAGELNEKATKEKGVITYYTSKDVNAAIKERDKYIATAISKHLGLDYPLSFNDIGKEIASKKDRLTQAQYVQNYFNLTENDVTLEELESHLNDENPIAYTSPDGKNITWKKLYEDKKFDQDFNALYDEYSSKSDWAEKSKFVSQANPNGINLEDFGEDLVLEYIHGDDSLREKITMARFGKASAQYPFSLGTKSLYDYGEQYGYDSLTDKEKELATYLKHSDVDAYNDYMLSLKDRLIERHNESEVERLYNVAQKHPVFSSVASVGYNMAGALEYLADVASGEIEEGNQMAARSSAIRQGVTEKIDWEIGNWDAFDFVYNTGMSMVDSVVSMTMFGKAGGVALGLSAAAQGTNDALERGLDNKQAFWHGFMNGVFEGFFETVSIGQFRALKKSLGTGFKNIAKNIGRSMLTNASEEMLTELANIAYDVAINADFSHYESMARTYVMQGMPLEEAQEQAQRDAIRQVVESTASGLLMGLGFGTGGSISAHKNAKAIEGQYNAESIDALIDKGLVFPGSEAYNLAQQYKEKIQGGKSLSAQEIVNIVEANKRALMTSAVKTRLTELGETGDVSSLAKAVVKKASGVKLTIADKIALKNSKYGQRIAKRINSDVYNRIEQQSNGSANIDGQAEANIGTSARDVASQASRGILSAISAANPKSDIMEEMKHKSAGVPWETGDQKLLRKIGQLFGAKVEFEDLDEIRVDDDGNRFLFSPEGEYDENTNTITLNTNVKDNHRPIQFILKHELTHSLEKAGVDYEKFMAEVEASDEFEAYVKKRGFESADKWYRHIIQQRMEAGKPLGSETESAETAAKKEAVADFVADILFDGRTTSLENLLKSLDPQTRTGFIEAIKKIFAKLKEILVGKPELTEIEQLEQKFLEVANKVAEMNATDPGQQKTTTGNSSGGKYSLDGKRKRSYSYYNEYATNIMVWANSATTKVGDVKVFKTHDGFALLEATDDGYIELKRGNFKEVKALEQQYREPDNSVYVYTEIVRNGKAGYSANNGITENNREYEQSGRQVGDQGLQSNSSRNNENLRRGNQGEQGVELSLSQNEQPVNSNSMQSGKRYSYAGPKSLTANKENLSEAEKREKSRKKSERDSENIRRELGWFRGMEPADKDKWKYEIDDSKAKLNLFTAEHKKLASELNRIIMEEGPPYDAATMKRIYEIADAMEKVSDFHNVKVLGDIFEHDELYAAYPELRDTKVEITDDMNINAIAEYDPNIDAIRINKDRIWSMDEAKMLEEVQHKIQVTEGFAEGSSIEFWRSLIERVSQLEKNAQNILDEIQIKYGIDVAVQADRFGELAQRVVDGEETRSLISEFSKLIDYAEQNGYMELFDEYFNYKQVVNYVHKKIGNRTPLQLYDATAGEIEAHDVGKRWKLTPEQRKEIRPDIDRTDFIRSEDFLPRKEKEKEFAFQSYDPQSSDAVSEKTEYESIIDGLVEILAPSKAENNGDFVEISEPKDITAIEIDGKDGIIKNNEGNSSRESVPYQKSRPPHSESVVEEVWNNAKDSIDGKVYDPSGKEIIWDRFRQRKGQWDMGHIPGQEYAIIHKKYMDGEISKEEFLKWHNNPKNYRPELPSTNRSHKYEQKYI